MNLFDHIKNVADCQCAGFNDETFNKRLAALQHYIGVQTGDVAAQFFSDYDDDCWETLTYIQKVNLLRDYIDTEISNSTDL